ncbi:hypothetical protein J9303_07520 [Bacillaceae bacterium Marseille-Q3522]|nr:hypothetical protein [Bacillaceae bacterium Marseille-Q3522]
MKKFLQNESGSSSFYFLWLLGIIALVFLIVTNIMKIYVVKQQVSLSAEQAAMAGTAVVLEETKKAIEEFDREPSWIAERILTGEDPIAEQVDDRKNSYKARGYREPEAYLKAVNDILPDKIDEHRKLKRILSDRINSSQGSIYSAVINIIDENDVSTDTNETEIFFTNEWQLAVKATGKFETIADNKYISSFLGKIPQRAYGPRIEYLHNLN